MPSPVFRFCVTDQTGSRSADWRVWVERNEIYAGARSTSHKYKASFHSSGQCHVGISRELREELLHDNSWTGKSRLFSHWTIDSPSTARPTVDLVELMFASSYLDVFERESDKTSMDLNCPEQMIVSVGLLKSLLPTGAPPLTSSDPTFRELARLPTNDGHTVIVMTRLLPETDEYHAYVRSRFWSHHLAQPTPEGRTYGRNEYERGDPNVRALLWDGTTQRKFWHEVSARKLLASGPP